MNVSSRRRLALLYLVAAALLISLGGRLYYIQVMNTTSFTKQAEQNQTRDVIVPAVRGQILGAAGLLGQGHHVHRDDQGRPVRDQLVADVVEDLAADRGHDHVPGLVLLGLLAERGGIHHLQVVEPAAERDDDGGRDQVEQDEAATRRDVHR